MEYGRANSWNQCYIFNQMFPFIDSFDATPVANAVGTLYHT